MIAQKYVVAWLGEPLEFGRRVQAEARRRGLAEAREEFVVADGSVWIWNVQAYRFGRAQGVLDFYHASQHLWSVARAWVEPLLHQLRHGQETGVLQTSDALPAWCVQQQRTLPPEATRERDYFASHRERVHYEAMAARGCPVGSGAMESFCAQLQGRFKRGGQFWSRRGLGNLLALDVAWRNLDWDALWLTKLDTVTPCTRTRLWPRRINCSQRNRRNSKKCGERLTAFTEFTNKNNSTVRLLANSSSCWKNSKNN